MNGAVRSLITTLGVGLLVCAVLVGLIPSGYDCGSTFFPSGQITQVCAAARTSLDVNIILAVLGFCLLLAARNFPEFDDRPAPSRPFGPMTPPPPVRPQDAQRRTGPRRPGSERPLRWSNSDD